MLNFSDKEAFQATRHRESVGGVGVLNLSDKEAFQVTGRRASVRTLNLAVSRWIGTLWGNCCAVRFHSGPWWGNMWSQWVGTLRGFCPVSFHVGL